MEETRYLISQAAKMVDVESHVLRFWEERMRLPIERNKKGQRCYTRQDIQIFLSIKELKNKGFSLEKITNLIPQLYGRKMEELPSEEQETNIQSLETAATTLEKEDSVLELNANVDKDLTPKVEESKVVEVDEEEKELKVTESKVDPFIEVSMEPDEAELIAKREQFEEIMERLIQEVQTERRSEGRYKYLDREIRARQVTRKMIAATVEDPKKKRNPFRIN